MVSARHRSDAVGEGVAGSSPATHDGWCPSVKSVGLTGNEIQAAEYRPSTLSNYFVRPEEANRDFLYWRA